MFVFSFLTRQDAILQLFCHAMSHAFLLNYMLKYVNCVITSSDLDAVSLGKRWI